MSILRGEEWGAPQMVSDQLTRRELLRAGGAGLISASFAACSLPMARVVASQSRPPAEAVILLWMDGGPSHLDTFDPKPEAPSSIRGEFRAIRTSGPDVQICDLLPQMARVMDKVTLVRSLCHQHHSHEGACHALLTGRSLDAGVVQPSVGSLVAYAYGQDKDVPAYIAVPGKGFGLDFGRMGSLPRSCGPVSVRALPEKRHSQRESAVLLERYGAHGFGHGCLRARRLVEDGARFVTVSLGGWDTHCDNAGALKGWLGPVLDQGMSALIEDLHQRGLLETTLVLWMGEFGRTPIINTLGGRDHWPQAGCALFAGAKVPGGQVIGKTDCRGMDVMERPVSPQDVAATIFQKLGIEARLTGITGRYITELG
jgi:uncharacterized protein (DUF1501 family)